MNRKMIFDIQIQDHYWHYEPSEYDQCSHGKVRINFANKLPALECDATTSAAAIHLMESVITDWSSETTQGGAHLVPCCGHAYYEGVKSSIFFIDCPAGLSWITTHQGGRTLLSGFSKGLDHFSKNTSKYPHRVELLRSDYANTAIKFADSVLDFYNTSKRKTVEDDETDRKRTALLWRYFDRLKSEVTKHTDIH